MIALPRVLIIIPGVVNYFYNQCGYRMAEALGEAGYDVQVSPLNLAPGDRFDLCLVSNIYETLNATEAYSRPEALERMRKIRAHSRALACIAIDCASTHWFGLNRAAADEVQADLFVDLGLFSQESVLTGSFRAPYYFACNGLTTSERQEADRARQQTDRPVPWAFIGHQTFTRVALVDYLVQAIHPSGFVYLPSLGVIKDKGSPHINQQQYEMVLRKTLFQVWCSHHSHFYLEVERYRTSLITGSVPIKTISSLGTVPDQVPMRFALCREEDLIERMSPDRYPELRDQHWNEWQRLPTLSAELRKLAHHLGITPPGPAQITSERGAA
jgi:hypothetical protein